MQIAKHGSDQLVQEHLVLLRELGQAQLRSTELLNAHVKEIARLRAQAIRLRAQVIMRETALAWLREDNAEREQEIPGLARRIALARRVQSLEVRVRELMDEQSRATSASMKFGDTARQEDPENLTNSLRAANLVVCQTGCLSHGAYWRLQNHCKRTGKTCIFVEEPDALRIVRIHKEHDGKSGVQVDTLRTEQISL